MSVTADHTWPTRATVKNKECRSLSLFDHLGMNTFGPQAR